MINRIDVVVVSMILVLLFSIMVSVSHGNSGSAGGNPITIYVNCQSTNTSLDCGFDPSEGNACSTINAAILAYYNLNETMIFSDQDIPLEIQLSPCVYKGKDNTQLYITTNINITIVGVNSGNDNEGVVIIDMGYNSNFINILGPVDPVTSPSPNPPMVLELTDIVFMNGLAAEGGVVNVQFQSIDNATVPTLVISQCTFSNNVATTYGGVFFINTTEESNRMPSPDYIQSVVIESCTFINNSAYSGAIFFATNTGSNVTVVNSTITQNSNLLTLFRGYTTKFTFSGCTITENQFSSESGSGVVASNDTLVISQSVITNNQNVESLMNSGSGGIIISVGSVLVDECLFQNNKIATIIEVQMAQLEIRSSQFIDNYSNSSGGVVRDFGGSTISITGSSFQNNKGYLGGAINVRKSSQIEIHDTILSGNSAYIGGAIYLDELETDALIINSNISYNSAFYLGGAIYCRGTTTYLNNMTESGNVEGITSTPAPIVTCLNTPAGTSTCNIIVFGDGANNNICSNNNNNNNNNNNGGGHKKLLNDGQIIGVIIGALVLFTLVFLGIIALYKRHQKNNNAQYPMLLNHDDDFNEGFQHKSFD